ncbi:short chain dehydrogenase reductase [Fusarium globosum]|uniref:Short chain dehydrogenase reductase n=1 Tax=Fusarium globosum TaxID=78864 RepID=A0A8H5UMV9_9HYPO|nr:short chain dehydrogenase reductase [Fusarium globosum]
MCSAKVFIADLSEPKESVPGSTYICTDVTQWNDLTKLFKTVIDSEGRLDVLFANAGVNVRENTFSDIYGEDGELAEPKYKCIDVNLVAEMNCVKLAIHYMKKQAEGGNIVITASKAAYSPMSGPTYAASKAGSIGMMRALRKFLTPLNIQLNAIAPGFTETGMLPAASVASLRELGVVIQTAATCSQAVAFLVTHRDYHTRTIQIVENRFREIESGYEAAAELMYGDTSAGRRTMGPEAFEIIRQTFVTTV